MLSVCFYVFFNGICIALLEDIDRQRMRKRYVGLFIHLITSNLSCHLVIMLKLISDHVDLYAVYVVRGNENDQ